MMRQSNYSAMMGGGYQQFGLDMRLMSAGPTGQRLLL